MPETRGAARKHTVALHSSASTAASGSGSARGSTSGSQAQSQARKSRSSLTLRNKTPYKSRAFVAIVKLSTVLRYQPSLRNFLLAIPEPTNEGPSVSSSSQHQNQCLRAEGVFTRQGIQDSIVQDAAAFDDPLGARFVSGIVNALAQLERNGLIKFLDVSGDTFEVTDLFRTRWNENVVNGLELPTSATDREVHTLVVRRIKRDMTPLKNETNAQLRMRLREYELHQQTFPANNADQTPASTYADAGIQTVYTAGPGPSISALQRDADETPVNTPGPSTVAAPSAASYAVSGVQGGAYPTPVSTQIRSANIFTSSELAELDLNRFGAPRPLARENSYPTPPSSRRQTADPGATGRSLACPPTPPSPTYGRALSRTGTGTQSFHRLPTPVLEEGEDVHTPDVNMTEANDESRTDVDMDTDDDDDGTPLSPLNYGSPSSNPATTVPSMQTRTSSTPTPNNAANAVVAGVAGIASTVGVISDRLPLTWRYISKLKTKYNDLRKRYQERSAELFRVTTNNGRLKKENLVLKEENVRIKGELDVVARHRDKLKGRLLGVQALVVNLDPDAP